jgi:outer membrane protein assembly factor BamE (lipoprotein component of BamABCDE complex)
MKAKCLAIWIILAILLFGCASTEIGRKFDASAANKIEIGKTTESEVLTMLGTPLKTKINQDGTKKYGYAHIESKAVALPFSVRGTASGDKLIITFDKDGVVRGLEKTSVPANQ